MFPEDVWQFGLVFAVYYHFSNKLSGALHTDPMSLVCMCKHTIPL